MVARGRRLAALLALGLVACPVAADPPRATTSPGAGGSTVIVLSLDGVRHDYLDRDPDGLPGLSRVAAEGLRAEALVPVFPSSTFPNHVSMATCAHVDRHGIVANRFHDRARGDFDYANDASWIEAEPLWAAAERQGVRSASFFWVGSETDWHGVGATYRKAPFDGELGEGAKVDQILAWIDLPAAERPRLIVSWWHGADHEGHRGGPDAPEVREQLRGQDAELVRLLAGLDAREAWGHTTLLLVSDHGMTAATELLDLGALLSEAGIESEILGGGAFANVFLADAGDADEALEAIRSVDGLRAWRGDAVPEELRYAHPTRLGDVVVLAAPPRRLGGRTSLPGLSFRLARLFDRPQGSHGYDPALPEMHGILLGLGRGIAPGTRLPRVSNLDVAPTVTRLLGIEPPRDCEGTPLPGIGAPVEKAPAP